VGSRQSIAKVVNESAKCNVSQLVSTEDGNSIVPTYDWTSFLAPHFARVKNINQHYHFLFSSWSPDLVEIFKKHCDDRAVNTNLLKSSPLTFCFPVFCASSSLRVVSRKGMVSS